MPGTALITGVGGQDGVLLSRHLLSLGYDVVGTVRPGAVQRLAPYLDGVRVVAHDVRDSARFEVMVDDLEPDEIYNLAAFSSVGRSWSEPDLVTEINARSVEGMLEAITRHAARTGRAPRFFQASSVEVFGPEAHQPTTADAPHHPSNPYGEAKSRAHRATIEHRERHGLPASVGILHNHESPLRSTDFVTRKITRAVAEIAAGLRESLVLGNLDVSRDWGAARDYVVAMHLAVCHDDPGDHVIASGQLHSLRDLVEKAFAAAGVTDPWQRVHSDPALHRTGDSEGRAGDPAPMREALGWEATTSFDDLVGDMVAVDLQRVRSGIEESLAYLVVSHEVGAR